MLWNGFECEEGIYNGRKFSVVKPTQSANGNPWILRAEFFGVSPPADIEMLRRGRYLVCYELGDMYGCPEAVEMLAQFFDYLVKKFSLMSRCVMAGFGKGALSAVNFTFRNIEKVLGLYLDSPILDIRSGFGKNQDSAEWRECKERYGIIGDYRKFHRNPLDFAPFLAVNGVPILCVVSDNDKDIPYFENTRILERMYPKGIIKVIHRFGYTDKPFGLEKPEVVCDFMCGLLSDIPEKD